MKIGIIGIGCVGNAIKEDFTSKGIEVIIYDKYKNGGIGLFEHTLICDLIFLCLPTPYDYHTKEYDKSSIFEICNRLKESEYKGIIILKSTVEPKTTFHIVEKTNLNIIHNPEFLTASTATNDFSNQKHIVLGYPKQHDLNVYNSLITFYKKYYPNSDYSIIDSTESELMKLTCNCFYAVKIQYFNEIYELSQKLNIDYNVVRNTVLKNGWINPMHTNVPGTDGNLSYGGMCFPKDTNAFNQFLIRNNTINKVLNATIEERNIIRKD